MNRIMKFLFSSILVLVVSMTTFGQSIKIKKDSTLKKHLIETSVLSPTIGVYQIIYNYNFSNKNAIVFGLAHSNIDHDPNQSLYNSIIVGYRRYFWKHAHIEAQIWIGNNTYTEESENKDYRGYQAFNENRLGYQFNWNLGRITLTVTPHFNFGFWLHKGNKPSSFDNPTFFYPNLLLGVKF